MNSAQYRSIMQYILPLMVISSLISQSLVDFFLIVVGFHWLYFFFKGGRREEFLPKTGLEWPFFGLFLAMLLSVLVNYWGRWEFLWPVHKIKWVFEFYAMLWFLRKYGFDAQKTVKTILFVGLLPSVYSLVTFFNGSDFFHPYRVTSNRVVGLVNSATYHAHASAILLGLVFYLFVENDRFKIKANKFLICCGGLFFVSLFLTYTRGALIALLASLALYFVFERRKYIWHLVACAMVVFTLLYQISPQLRTRVSETVDPQKIDISRIGLLRAYSEVFADHWLFGAGYDSYKIDNSIAEYTIRHGVHESLQDSHAHNQYLQIAATTGIFGISFFIIIFLSTLLKLIRLPRAFYAFELNRVTPIYTIVVIGILMGTDQTFEYAKIRIVVVYTLVVSYFLLLNSKDLITNSKKDSL